MTLYTHKFGLLVRIAFLFWTVTSSVHGSTTEFRCGWFDNPSPGNASLFDRDGEWTIAMQGSYEAKGDWPKFSKERWVQTGHGGSGHGCACVRVYANREKREIVRILTAEAQPLSACRRDKSLKEPVNPLK